MHRAMLFLRIIGHYQDLELPSFININSIILPTIYSHRGIGFALVGESLRFRTTN